MTKRGDDREKVQEPDWETSDARQKRRQPTVLHDKSSTIVAWDPRLALELAMTDPEGAMKVFERYGIGQDAAIELVGNPLFVKQLEQYKVELESSGMSFRMKAKILAEDLLPEAYDIAKDSTYPAAVRADMIQWITKMADLEPVKAGGKDVAQQGGFSLQILFAGQAPGSGADAASIGAAGITDGTGRMAGLRAAGDNAVTIEHQP